MICYKQIIPQELADQGKNFNWGNHFCNNCKRNMWGHGLVPKYFSHLQFPIFLKRYRCPDCSVVVTMRPESYWSYLRTSTLIIFMALRYRINEFKWPWYVGRQVGGHWLKRLVRHAQMELVDDLTSFLDNCFFKNIHFFP